MDQEFGEKLDVCLPICKDKQTIEEQEEEAEQNKEISNSSLDSIDFEEMDVKQVAMHNVKFLSTGTPNLALSMGKEAGENKKKQSILDEADTLLCRDNLKIKQIAKYNCLLNQEWGRYDEIEKDLLDMAYLKRAAFNDSSIEEMEREIISELSHRGQNNMEANFGRRSENSEALNSVRSS